MNWNLNILLSILPANNVNPKIMEVVSLCRSTLDANSPSPRSQIPSLTQKGYAIYKSTTTFCALCILSCNSGLVHFWAIWLAKLDNIILTVFCEYIYLVQTVGYCGYYVYWLDFCLQINGQWKGLSAGGCGNYKDSYKNNPIYQINLERSGPLLIELRGSRWTPYTLVGILRRNIPNVV